MSELFIRDDIGEVWTFNGGRITLAGDDEEGSGHYCSSWEEAVEILNKEGYISNEKHSPWISVEDRLPELVYRGIREESSERVLGRKDVNGDPCFFITTHHKPLNGGDSYMTDSPSEWMKLPK